MLDSIRSATGRKQESPHQLNHVAGSEVFASLFVVLFVESPDEFLEHGPHAVIVERRELDAPVGILDRQWREIHLRVEEVFNQVA